MKNCKKCGNEIAKSAKICPKCGAKQGLPAIVKVFIILGIVLVCLIGCVASCTKGVSDAVDEAVKENKDEHADINGKKEFKVGESFQNKHLKITVKSADLNYKLTGKYAEYNKPDSGKKYVRVDIVAENIGKESENITSMEFNMYADDVKANQEYITLEDDNNDFGGTISPGKTTKGPIVYQVPKDARKVVLEYQPNILDSKYIVKFILK